MRTEVWGFWLRIRFKNLALALLSIPFIALSVWQFQRAEVKASLIAERDMRQGGFEALLLSSGDVADRQPGDPVRVLGYWQPCTALNTLNTANTGGARGDLIVLDNRPRDRVPGYQVFAPLYLHDDSVALIFRGWMPALDRRENLSSQLAQTSEWRGNAGLLSNGVAGVTSGAIAEAQERACDASRQLVPVQGTLWKPDRRPLGVSLPISAIRSQE